MNFKIELNGTLLLAYIITLICLIFAWKGNDFKSFVDALPYICLLAGVRVLPKLKK